jgi:glycosyltransferase involved in cell wall biosynthesis
MAKIAAVDLIFQWPPLGGSSCDLKEVLSRLARIHEVVLFTCDYSKFFPRRRLNLNIELPFRIHPIPFGWWSFNFMVLPRRIKEAVKEFDPDYVFVADGFQLKPFIVNALSEYPIFLRFYAYELLCLRGFQLFRNGQICKNTFLKNSLKCQLCSLRLGKDIHFLELLVSLGLFPFYRKVTEKTLRQVKGIIVYNQFTKDFLNLYNQNVQVTPSGVDTSRFFPTEEKEKAKPMILFCGRVNNSAKGFHVLRVALKTLKRKGHDFELVVTSKRKFKEDYISSAGWLDQDQLIRLYQKSDICVVPSIWQEPFGIVAVEAMACGKPVIASKVGGLQNIVEDGKTGFLVPPGDPKALSEKIEILLTNPKLRQEMGEKGREKAEREYDWDKIFEKYYIPLFK